ncbi:hypothetical protein [Anaerobiospirillum thomasii]|uniref:Uncharacterized protein n=1 Tax=Anaerobiospirillum thomasii TaxID=179995 RepID=A0A2X0V864_9GAMM|nr:hypothetical protein [Anaerobiospirillum thomasii]SPT70579.1 Uncharacterised protein [Anaerobiospirillum thomasii]
MIKDLDETRSKATDYGQIINKLNSQKDFLDKNGELLIGHRLYLDDLKKELEQIDKFINNLRELEGMFRGTIPIKEELKPDQAIDDDSTHPEIPVFLLFHTYIKLM